MDELEKVFKTHKQSFDRLKPKTKVWDAIREGTVIDNSKPTSINIGKVLLSIAASAIILIGLKIVLQQNTQGQTQFDNLVMTAPNGEEVLLDPSLNKYTLIQFWSSGNVVCDEKNCYYYLPAYEKYKDRGFEIYAISLDEDKNQWIKSIEDNNLSWIHVSDLKGWQSPICIECNISKVPTTYLLDQEGNIILEDLNAEILDETLSKLLADN